MIAPAIFVSAIAQATSGSVTGREFGAFLAAVGVIGAAWIGARYTARSAIRVAEVNREVKQEEVEVNNATVIMEGLRRDIERGDRERESLVTQLEEIRRQMAERDRRDELDRTARLIHVGYDWNTYNIVHQHSLSCPDPEAREMMKRVGTPPPLYAAPNT